MRIIDQWYVSRGRTELRITLLHDPVPEPFDSRVYSEADVRAWQQGGWCFVKAEVLPVLRHSVVFAECVQAAGPFPYGSIPALGTVGRDWFEAQRLPEMAEAAMADLEIQLDTVADELRRMGWTVVSPTGVGES